MKLQLNKKKLKNLSKDAEILPSDLTPEVAGGTAGCTGTYECEQSGQCVTSPHMCAPSQRACNTFACTNGCGGGFTGGACVSGYCNSDICTTK